MSEMNVGVVETAVQWGLLKSLMGKSFCLTGKMSLTRQGMSALIQALGGECHDAVKKSTTFLIIPNEEEFRKGSKFRAAMSHGTMCITEEDFAGLILPTVDELLAGLEN